MLKKILILEDYFVVFTHRANINTIKILKMDKYVDNFSVF